MHRHARMPLSDDISLAVALPLAAAIYWRRGIYARIRQAIRRRRAQPISNLPTQPAAARETFNNPLTPLGFERMCADVLTSYGWLTNLTVTSGDQGVDVLARKGRISVVIQCKLYSRPVGNDAVQQAIAGRQFTGATHAAVVSNQPYTRSAKELAARDYVLLLSPDDLSRADDLFK